MRNNPRGTICLGGPQHDKVYRFDLNAGYLACFEDSEGNPVSYYRGTGRFIRTRWKRGLKGTLRYEALYMDPDVADALRELQEEVRS